MSVPEKEIEVELKGLGCPYDVLDARTLVWLEGFRKGRSIGMDEGARIVGDVYDKAIAEVGK